MCDVFFFFNDTATTEIYTLSLHDALPILRRMLATLRDAHTRVFAPEERSEWHRPVFTSVGVFVREIEGQLVVTHVEDRKSTRLNSSHANISYAVFCLKKKKKKILHTSRPR